MNQLNSHKTGLVLGAFIGGLHVVWSLLVLIGWAQPLLDLIFTLHMVTPLFVVSAFSLSLAGTLIVVVALIGYVVGQIFARAWNQLYQ